MAIVKQVKSKSYFKRYQVQFRRRRQGKTDYYARRRLTHMDKNKYDTKKYRLVVRRTNSKIIAQVIYNTIKGDRVIAQATSAELKKFGLTAGLTNYAACYSTGLLIARRLLADLKMADMYKGQEAPNGELYDVNDNQGERRPFKCCLDVGLSRTTTGARVFAVLKGAADGGLYVPHNEKRFVGYSVEKVEKVVNKRGKAQQEQEKAKGQLDTAVLRSHIFGGHVQAYMDQTKKESKDRYNKLFSKWDKCLKDSKSANLEALYKKVHSEIRKNPAFKKSDKKASKPKVVQKPDNGELILQNSKGKKWLRHKKLTLAKRKERIAGRIQAAITKQA